jgi:hypothetical protein
MMLNEDDVRRAKVAFRVVGRAQHLLWRFEQCMTNNDDETISRVKEVADESHAEIVALKAFWKPDLAEMVTPYINGSPHAWFAELCSDLTEARRLSEDVAFRGRDDPENEKLNALCRRLQIKDHTLDMLWRNTIRRTTKRHTSATADRDGKVALLKSMLTRRYFNDDDEVIDDAELLTHGAIVEMMKQHKGWSASSVTRLFKEAFKPDGDYSSYEKLATNNPASLRRYLGDTEGRLPMTDGNKAVSVAPARMKR